MVTPHPPSLPNRQTHGQIDGTLQLTSGCFHGNSEVKLWGGQGGCDWLAGRVGSYHIGGFEGVPLAADAARDTETKTGVLLYPHTQLEEEEDENRGGQGGRKKERKEEKQVKVKCTDHNGLYASIEQVRQHVEKCWRRAFMWRATCAGKLFWRS